MVRVLLVALVCYAFEGHERVLDVGCGDGSITAQLAHEVPDGFVLGIDGDEAVIGFAERTYDPDLFANLAFAAVDPAELTQVAQFDLVVCHAPPTPSMIERLVRALRPGGRLLVEGVAEPTCVHEALQAVAQSESWKDWLSSYAPVHFSSKPLAQAGLLPQKIEAPAHQETFADRHAVAEWLKEWLPQQVTVPDYRKEALSDAVIDELLSGHPELQDANGFRIPFAALSVEAKKL